MTQLESNLTQVKKSNLSLVICQPYLHEVDAELSRQGGGVLGGVPADVVQLSGRRRLHVVDADAAVGEQAVLGSLALDALGLEEARYGRVCVPVSQVLKWVSRRVNLLFINDCR